jgi:predicted O-linked N-acetylglucosamine transferase (SPINDLY family)
MNQLLQTAINFHSLGKFAEARRLYCEVLKLDPDNVIATHWLGVLQATDGELEQAYKTLLAAQQLAPNDPQIKAHIGGCLLSLELYEQAIPYLTESLAIHTQSPSAWANLAVAHYSLADYPAALFSINKSLELDTRNSETYTTKGNIAVALNDVEMAWQCYTTAQNMAPRSVNNVLNFVLFVRDKLGDISMALKLMNTLSTEEQCNPKIIGELIYTKMKGCDWKEISNLNNLILEGVERGDLVIQPFAFLAMCDDPALQKKCSENFNKRLKSNKTPHQDTKTTSSEQKEISIGFISPDFRDHAVAYLIVELLEEIKSQQIHAIGFYLNSPTDTKIGVRLKSAFEENIDLSSVSDIEAAAVIAKKNVNALIDLAGLTKGARPMIFASRPCPIQLTWLGYPGTVCDPNLDYLIADESTIPIGYEKYFSEQILRLPNSYQPNDSTRLALRDTKRVDHSLPEDAFVLACFNNAFKITEVIFSLWCQILAEYKGAVLWILEDNSLSRKNLTDHATTYGVADQLVWAKRVDNDEHLSRLCLADLILDTFPYTAHTSASDALWCGVPIVTIAGRSFVSRVCASILKNLGLNVLIADDLETYRKKIETLITNKEDYARLRKKVTESKHSDFFNMKLFAENFEQLVLKLIRETQKNQATSRYS